MIAFVIIVVCCTKAARERNAALQRNHDLQHHDVHANVYTAHGEVYVESAPIPNQNSQKLVVHGGLDATTVPLVQPMAPANYGYGQPVYYGSDPQQDQNYGYRLPYAAPTSGVSPIPNIEPSPYPS